MTGKPNQHLLIFHVGRWRFGVRMPHVKQVQTADSRWDHTEPCGDVEALTVEGNTLPVYRLHRLLGTSPLADEKHGAKVLILNHPEQGFGLLADRVEGVIAVDPRQISPLPPAFGAVAGACFAEVYNQNGRPVLMIRPEGLATQCGRLAAARMGENSSAGKDHRPLSIAADDDTHTPVALSENDAADFGSNRDQVRPPEIETGDKGSTRPSGDLDIIGEDRFEKIFCKAIETIAQQKMERLFARAFLMSQTRL